MKKTWSYSYCLMFGSLNISPPIYIISKCFDHANDLHDNDDNKLTSANQFHACS